MRYRADVPFSWRPLAVTLGFLGVDALLLPHQLRTSDAWVVPGLVALVMATLGLGLSAFEALVQLTGRRVRQPKHRAMLAGLLSLGPAIVFALVLTEGAGIQRSGWAPTVALVVVLGLVGAAAVSPLLPPSLEGRPRSRRLLGLALLLVTFALTAVLSIYPVQYIRLHRGILVIAMLLGLGALWVVTPGWRAARRTTAIMLAGLSAAGLTVFLAERTSIELALSETFDATLITQKLQGPLSEVLLGEQEGLEVDEQLRERLGTLPSAPASAPFPGRDVILFTGDTIRADRLLGPRASEIAPTLAGWKAFRFPRAATNHTITDGAFPSLLSGRWFPQRDEIASWSETFRGAGYETMAVFPLRPHFRHLNTFDQHLRWKTDCLEGLSLAKKALAQVPADRPLMLWMHSIDAHVPHRFRAEDDQFGPGPIGTYDAAIHLFDRCFAQFRTLLEEAGRWDDALVVVTADHGESLGEGGRMLLHGGCGAADVRIPLLIRLPDMSRQPEPIDFWFQSTDLLPTLASLIDAKLHTVPQGRDLSGLFSNPRPEPRGWALTIGENSRCSSLLVEDWHLVHDARGQFSALYDLAEDPAERVNVRSAHPETTRELDGVRRELLRQTQPLPPRRP